MWREPGSWGLQGHPAPAATCVSARVLSSVGDGSQLPRSPSSRHGLWVGEGWDPPTQLHRPGAPQEVMYRRLFATSAQALGMLPPSLLLAGFGSNGAAVEGWRAARTAIAAGRRGVGVTGKRTGSHWGSGWVSELM